mmetsp:Transcript_15944/g.21632  ORF Transcript_15944/g.21632 Transcript_15944/m.21632 type:complete len:213 (+) Transcript_15944:62-700(+)
MLPHFHFYQIRGASKDQARRGDSLTCSVGRAFARFRLLVSGGQSVALVAVASQACHPAHVLVDVVAARHVHDFAGVSLSVLVLELGSKWLVGAAQERVSQFVLLFRLKHLRARQAPRLLRIKLCCVFIRAQIHAEGQLVFRELACFDQVVVLVGVAYEVNVKVRGCRHRLPAASALDDALELGPGCSDLASRVLGLLQAFVCIHLFKVVVAC